MIASSPNGARAPSRLLRISFRRPRPAPAAPSLRAATASARSASLDRIGLRSLTISSSGIRVLAQWMAPTPMQNSESPRPSPSSLVERPTCSSISSPSAPTGLIAKYATMNSSVPSVESPKKVATSRSRRCAALGSMSERR